MEYAPLFDFLFPSRHVPPGGLAQPNLGWSEGHTGAMAWETRVVEGNVKDSQFVVRSYVFSRGLRGWEDRTASSSWHIEYCCEAKAARGSESDDGSLPALNR